MTSTIRTPSIALLTALLAPLLTTPAQAQDPADTHAAAHGHAHTADPALLTIRDVLALERNQAARTPIAAGVAGSAHHSLRSGAGDFTFEVQVTAKALPDAVRATNPHDKRKRSILECAHGGFGYDHREGRGEVYWFLQGAGILRINRDRTQIDLLETDPMMQPLNMHNATFFEHEGAARIAWPANSGQRVFVTDEKGALIHTIGRPTANQYTEKARYSPTDTAYLDGHLWITDGYGSKYVLAYDLTKAGWTDLIFGGHSKQAEPSRFGTNHGITIHKGLLWVSGRYFARIHSYQPDTTFVNMFALPEGSRPCDFEFFVLDDKLYGVAASLDKPKGSGDTGASIYIVDMESLEVVSTIRPKDELGLEKFVHLHNVFPTVEDGRVTLFCQAWNPGDFAVLRQTVAPDK